jgi:hypothetical protein
MTFEDNENYDYNPVPSIFYKFDINEMLLQDVDDLLNQKSVQNIYLVSYSINNTGVYPFIQYYLCKEYGNVLSFPLFNIREFVDVDSEKLISFSKCFLYTIFSNEKNDKDNEFKGFYYFNSDVFLFFDFSQCNLNLNDIYKNSTVWTVISTELYQSTVLDMKISDIVTDFFMNNIQLLYLKDTDNKVYELPDVWYCGREENLLNFTYTFGVSKNINGILGSHYYFTNYKNAILEGCWSKNKEEKKYGKIISDKNGKYIKGGIVRFAIFTGKCLIKLNKIDDPIDDSEIKNTKLEELGDNLYEKLTIRLSDYDGKWCEIYDSVYIGNIELDNGERFKEGPLLAIKNYNQQIPLSYHYIDNRHITNMDNLEQRLTIQ